MQQSTFCGNVKQVISPLIKTARLIPFKEASVSISSDKSIPITSIPISAKYSLTEPVPQARSKTELQFAQFSLKKS